MHRLASDELPAPPPSSYRTFYHAHCHSYRNSNDVASDSFYCLSINCRQSRQHRIAVDWTIGVAGNSDEIIPLLHFAGDNY